MMVPYHGHEHNEYETLLLTMMSPMMSRCNTSFHPFCVSFSRQVLCRIGLHEVHSTIDQADLTAPLGAVNQSKITPNCRIDLTAFYCLEVLMRFI